MDTFNACVQYNDFKGTVAADLSANVALADYLVSLGKAGSDERVVGFRIASGENRGTPVTDVSLVAYLLGSAELEPGAGKSVVWGKSASVGVDFGGRGRLQRNT